MSAPALRDAGLTACRMEAETVAFLGPAHPQLEVVRGALADLAKALLTASLADDPAEHVREAVTQRAAITALLRHVRERCADAPRFNELTGQLAVLAALLELVADQP